LRRYTAAELGAVSLLPGRFSKYLNSHETSILIALVNSVAPQVMIEFGCNEGITAKRILENVPTLRRYIGIDVPYGNRPTLKCQETETPLNAGWYAANDPRFFYLEARSQMLRTAHLEACDAVFIDGDHSESAVLHESHLARRLLRKPGVIIWHDFNNPAVEVTHALETLQHEGWPINCVENSWLAFLRVEKPNADKAAQG
jgi:predicted O-methyltransferase YrrM